MAATFFVKSGYVPEDGTALSLTETGFGTPDFALVVSPTGWAESNPNSSNQAISFGFIGPASSEAASFVTLGGRYSSNYIVARQQLPEYSGALITDGVSITLDNAESTSIDRQVFVIAFNGITNVDMRFLADLQGGGATVSGLGWNPNAAVVMSTGLGAENTSGIGNSIFSLGFASKNTGGTTQAGILWEVNDDAEYPSNSIVTGQLFSGSVTWSNGITFTSGGYQTGTGSGGSGDGAFIIAFELPNADDSIVKVIDTPGSTGTQAYTGFGFQPDAAIFIPTSSSSLNTVNGTNSSGIFTGFDDTTTAVSGALTSEVGGGTDQSEMKTGASVYLNPNGTASQVASIDSVQSDGFTLDWTTSSASGTKVLVWAFGDSNATGGTTPTLSTATVNVTGQSTATVGCTVTF